MTNQSDDTHNNPNSSQQNLPQQNPTQQNLPQQDPIQQNLPQVDDNSEDMVSQKVKPYDSISLMELTTLKNQFDPIIEPVVNPQNNIYEKVDNFLQQFEKEKKDLSSDSLKESIELIKEYHFNIDKVEKALTSGLTAHQLRIGKMLCSIKSYVSSFHIKWESWANEHLAFMNKRTRQTYMQLAQIKNVEPYIMLGKERLILSSNVIKEVIDKDDQDPIGTFLTRHEIDFTTATEKPIAEFKNTLDSAVVIEKAFKNDLILDRQLVEGLVEIGFKFTNSDYTYLKDIQEAAEKKPDQILKDLLTNNGQRKKAYGSAKKKKDSFTELNARMKKLVDHMIENEDFDGILTHDVNELIKHLQKLTETLKNQTD